MLYPDFRDLLAAFAAHGVDHLVVGGYAVVFHARPRFTKDIDLWVGHSPENLKRARAALEEFGAPAAMLERLESALDEDVLWMGVPPVRIDVVKGTPFKVFDLAGRAFESPCISRGNGERFRRTGCAEGAWTS